MTLLSHAPQLTLRDAEHLARELFGLAATASALPSERDQNFRLHTDDGRGAGAEDRQRGRSPRDARGRERDDAAARRHRAGAHARPHPRRRRHRSTRRTTPCASSPRSTAARSATRHDRAMPCSAIWAARSAWWIARWRASTIPRSTASSTGISRRRPSVIAERLPLVRDTALRLLIERAVAVYDGTVAPHLASFRRSAIHGDANDYNVLVDARTQRVTGIVDFGDMVVSHTVNDVAIAMAYAALGKPDPLQAAAHVAAGYHAVNPLTDDEIAALLRLDADAPGPERVRGRRAAGGEAGPGVPRASARRPSAPRCRRCSRCTRGWRTTGCATPWGSRPFRTRHASSSGFALNGHTAAPLTGHDLKTAAVLGLDFSAGSTLVSSDPADNLAEPFSRRVFAAMQRRRRHRRRRRVRRGAAHLRGPGVRRRRGRRRAPHRAHRPRSHDARGLTALRAVRRRGPRIRGRHDAARLRAGHRAAARDRRDEAPVTFYTLYGHLEPPEPRRAARRQGR